MKKIKTLLAVILISGLLAGCGSNSNVKTDNKKTSVDLSKVTLRVSETGWGNLDLGFKAAGIDNTPYKVEYSVFQGGNLVLEAMAGSHIDLGLTSEIPPLFGDNSNYKIIAVEQANTLLQELVIPKGSSIKTVADLKGKKVAYISGTTSQYFLSKMLEKGGLSWKDIDAVQMTTSDGLTALIGGKIDALASYGNGIITAHQNGATTLASGEKILSGNYPLEATNDAIKDPSKHAAIVDYLKRLNEFYDWTRKNPDKWAQITATNTHQDETQALGTFKNGEKEIPTKVVANSTKAIASQQDIADSFEKLGLFKDKVDVKTIWSDSFTKELNK